MRFLFGLSIALNLFLLTTIVAARVDSTRDPIPIRLGTEAEFQINDSAASGNQVDAIHDFVAIAQQSSLGVNDIKILTLGWLLEMYRGSYDTEGPRYWQPGYSPQLFAIETRIAIEQRVRDTLIEIFGHGAAFDSAFDSVFRPLGLEYAFLDSQSQLDLQRSQFDLLTARAAVRDTQAPQIAQCLAGNQNFARAPMASGLPANFTPAATREYQLRFSPLAQQLRESGVADDEQEFRELFDQFQQLEIDPSPAQQADTRAALRATVGDEDFDRLWSKRDPFYYSIEQFLVAEGFSPHLVQAAYSVVNSSQEALLHAMGQGANSESMMSAVAQIKRDEAQQLSRLLGDKAVAGLSGAISEAAMRLNDSSIGTC